MNRLHLIFGLGAALLISAAEPELPYLNRFDHATLDRVPEEFTVLDGAFAVKEAGGDKFLELPGAPLDTFGVLFGPTESEGVVATCRVYGTAKGRRYPTFALGLNGLGGYRLQVNPAKNAIELLRGESARATSPWSWSSGKWTYLKIQVQKTGSGEVIKGKAWVDGTAEPNDWMITVEDKDALPPGKTLISASPFAGTPIRFDDLSVQRISAGSDARP